MNTSEPPMRIGVLQADSVLASLQPEHHDYPDMFVRLLSGCGIAPNQCLAIDAQAERLPAVDIADAYVITGSKHSVYDALPWIPRLAEFVRAALTSGRRVIGICFGHQLLAHYFGGRVAPAAAGWRVGVNFNEVVAQPHWMQPRLGQFAVLVSHQDQVLEMPPGAALLARSAACPVAAFEMPEGALAIQGHPEFDKAYMRALLQMRQLQLGPATFNSGLESLVQPTNSDAVACWMGHFLRPRTPRSGT